MRAEPLIAEDLMLLMMDDRSGAIAGAGTLMYALGGAVLAELALLGRVETEESTSFLGGLSGPTVHGVGSDPLPDPLLQQGWDTVAEKPRRAQTLLITIGTPLREPIIDRLIERGHLHRETKKVLGLFTATKLPAAGDGYEAALLARVRGVLVDGSTPDPRTGVLIALLSASGTLTSLHRDIPWGTTTYQRSKEIEAGNWGAGAVGTAVERTTAAIAASGAAAVAAATVAANSGN